MTMSVFLRKAKPYAAMVMLQFGYAGMYIISVATLKQGMNHYVLVVYRNATAAVVMAPFALWFERIVLDQNFYYMGTKLTSASYASALVNILPSITFIMALVLRMEKLKLKERHSQAKIVGTLVTVAGALLMILYKGPIVEFAWTRGRSHHTEASSQDEGDFLKGTFILLGSCICWSGFFVLQSNTLQSYPAELSLTTLICVTGVAMSSAVALVAEHHSGATPWIIGWDTRLFAAIYSGIVCSGIAYYIQGVVMKERGPVFVTAFNPLCMIIVAVLGSIILAEEITVGRMTGAIIIAIGLYALIWGKSKDHLTSVEEPEKKGLELPTAKKSDVKFGSTELVTVVEIPTLKNT